MQELIGVDAAFGVTLGDLVFDDLNLFDPLNQVVGQIGIPWIHVLGNHDIDFSAETNWNARGAYYRTYGPSWYAFSQSHVHFVVVDNIRWIVEEDNRYYRTGLGEDQMSFIRNFLEHIPEDELVVFLAHIPWVGSTSWKDEAEKKEFFELMASRPHALSLVAHRHRHYHHFIDREEGWPNEQPHHMISIGTVCGAWWRGAPDEYGIPHAMMSDGTPTGYSFLEVQGDEWKLSWKSARRPADFQMHLHAPDEVSTDELARGVALYANIFNALPDAHVTMSVGQTDYSSEMTVAREEDPVYAAMHEREQALEDIPWLRTRNPDSEPRHLWKGTLPDHLEPGTYTLHVRSEDAWHVYDGQRIIRVTTP